MGFKRLPVPSTWVVSSALLVVAGVFCVRSRWRTDVIAFFPPSAHLQAVATERREVLVFLSDVPFDPQYSWSNDAVSGSATDFEQAHSALVESATQWWNWASFQLARDRLGSMTGAGLFTPMAGYWRYMAIVVPWWGLMLLMAILPLRRVSRAVVKRRRHRLAMCIDCGYDLRGSTTNCPECGLPIRPVRQLEDRRPRQAQQPIQRLFRQLSDISEPWPHGAQAEVHSANQISFWGKEGVP